MAHAVEIAEEVEQKLFRQGVPEPSASEAKRNRSEFSFQDRQEIGRPAFYSGQVSLFRSHPTLTAGHKRAGRRYVFVNTLLPGAAVTQRNREGRDPVFCLNIHDRMQASEDCPGYQ